MSTQKKISLTLTDWVSPSEAARIRGVSRQAIGKLIRTGRIRTLDIAGKTLLNLLEVKAFKPSPPGRKKVTKKK